MTVPPERCFPHLNVFQDGWPRELFCDPGGFNCNWLLQGDKKCLTWSLRLTTYLKSENLNLAVWYHTEQCLNLFAVLIWDDWVMALWLTIWMWVFSKHGLKYSDTFSGLCFFYIHLLNSLHSWGNWFHQRATHQIKPGPVYNLVSEIDITVLIWCKHTSIFFKLIN